jgi:hypothetical protein
MTSFPLEGGRIEDGGARAAVIRIAHVASRLKCDAFSVAGRTLAPAPLPLREREP